MLAFDRDRVRSLASAVTGLAVDLERWMAAARDLPDAVGALAAGSRALVRWPPRLAELAACDAMERHPAIARRDGDRAGVEARLFAEWIGWEVVRDGHDDRALLRDTQLAALVRRLDDASRRDLLDDVIVTGDAAVLALVIAALAPAASGGAIEALLASLPREHVGIVAVHLGTTPDLARATLAAIERLDGGLALLVYGIAEPEAVNDLVARAVVDLPPAAAGPIVLAYSRLVVQGGTSDDAAYRRHLGGLVAPYLLQFTSRAADWQLDPRDGARLLADILRDDGAMQELLAARDRWATPTSMGGIDDALASLDELAGMLGWFDAIAHDEEIDDGLAQRALWDLSWFAIGATVNLAIRATGITGGAHTVADRIADEALARLQRQMELDGSFGAPDTPEEIRADAAARHDWRRAALAAAAAAAVVEVLRADGRRLPDPPPPPPPLAPAPAPAPRDGACSSSRWLDEFDAWAASLDRKSRRVLDHAVRTVLNRYQAAEACYQIDRG